MPVSKSMYNIFFYTFAHYNIMVFTSELATKKNESAFAIIDYNYSYINAFQLYGFSHTYQINKLGISFHSNYYYSLFIFNN